MAVVKVNGSEVINNCGENQQVINNGSEKENENESVEPKSQEVEKENENESVEPKSQEVINNGSEKKENESVVRKSQEVEKENNYSEKEKKNESIPKSLYVGDLEPNVTDAQIQELFQGIGSVVSVHICRDAMTKTSLGYGYVNYSTAENATEALRTLNFTPLNGKPIWIMYSQRDPTIRNSGSANIFIKNLHKAVDNKTLYHKFCVFGPILSSEIAMDASGQSKGYGFVHFEKEEAAQNAIKCMNGALINDIPVYVAPFIKKEERKN